MCTDFSEKADIDPCPGFLILLQDLGNVTSLINEYLHLITPLGIIRIPGAVIGS